MRNLTSFPVVGATTVGLVIVASDNVTFVQILVYEFVIGSPSGSELSMPSRVTTDSSITV